VSVATAVRRFKSEQSLPLSAEMALLRVAPADPLLYDALQAATTDLMSVARARQVEICRAGQGTGPLGIEAQEGLEIEITHQDPLPAPR
jgi:hypothetical protein